MSFLLTRMFAYFTIAMYLVVGTVAVRVLAPESVTLSVSTSYFDLFKKAELKSVEADLIVAPELAFNEIKFPVIKKKIYATKVAVVKPSPIEFSQEKVAPNELPFNEPVKLSALVLEAELSTNMASLYTDFKYEMIADVEQVEDSISTKLASDAEPEFFDYADQKEVVAKTEESKKEIIPEEISTNSQSVNIVDSVQDVDANAEEVAVDELLAFDYSKANEDIKAEAIPTVSTVTTQNVGAGITPPKPTHLALKPTVSKSTSKMTTQENERDNEQENYFLDDKSVDPAAKAFSNKMTIQITGTNLKKTQSELGFEVRYQDDLNDVVQDYNSGEITTEQVLAEEKMTRAVTVLKRGFASTNTDLILEEGVSSVSVPLIDDDTFNELLAPYESRGPIGAVLVELDDDVEGATLDVPYSQVLKLDSDLKVTEETDFSYQLFVGVKAGNSLLSYKTTSGETTSKIINIHERELTFEANFFEDVTNERVKILEEDLLGKEKTPLIISGEEVKEFATNKTAKKVNDHTYKTDFGRTLLGGRRYLELSHQSEPVFVGFKDVSTLEIPSENFMRHILSRLEDSRLGSRCLVQVNLPKKAVKVDVGSESISSSLQTITQILDADGKFYDSLSPKSKKIIVVGENQGGPENGLDAKINLKITYEDGTVHHLGTYCSPNTYLVEQL